MNTIYGALHTFFKNHSQLRDYIRMVRWYIKRVPVFRECLIFFEKRYFGSAGDERPEGEASFAADDYSESYARVLLPKVFGRVLDLGCGHGYLTRRMAQVEAVYSVVGVDKIGDFRAHHPKITYLARDLVSNLKVPGVFDVVVSTELIEHISEAELRNLLITIPRFLKKDGIFIGSTPINPSRHYDVFSGSRFHIKEYRLIELENLLSEFFKDVKVTPISRFCMTWEAKVSQ